MKRIITLLALAVSSFPAISQSVDLQGWPLGRRLIVDTGWVRSLTLNALGDSLIYYKSGVRFSLKFPSSFWSVSGTDITNTNVGTTNGVKISNKLTVGSSGMFVVNPNTGTMSLTTTGTGGANTVTSGGGSGGLSVISTANDFASSGSMSVKGPQTLFDQQSSTNGRARFYNDIAYIKMQYDKTVSSILRSNSFTLNENGFIYADGGRTAGIQYSGVDTALFGNGSLVNKDWVVRRIANAGGGSGGSGNFQAVTNLDSATTNRITVGSLRITPNSKNPTATIQLVNNASQPRNVIQSGDITGNPAAEGSITFATGASPIYELNSGENNTFKNITDAAFEWWNYGTSGYVKTAKLTEDSFVLKVPIRYLVGTPGAGKVMTSDANGVISLVTPASNFTTDSVNTAVPIRFRNGVVSADINWGASISGYGTITKNDSTVATIGYVTNYAVGTAGTSTITGNKTISGNTSFTGAVTSSKDIEITDYTKGYILTSPDGSRWRLTIRNDGVLIPTKL